MRINTKTNKIELLKAESEALSKAQAISRTLAKHADGDVLKMAERAADDLHNLKTALAEQGQEEEMAKPY